MRDARSLILGAAVAAVGCASGGAPAPRATTEQVVTVSARDDLPLASVVITRDEFVSRAELAGPRDEAWRALPAVFEEVGLPRPVTDRATWTAQVRNHPVRRRLGEDRLSRFLDCGRDIGGAYADSYSIRLTVTVELREGSGEHAVALTRVDATGQRIDGTGGTVRCNSYGTLEQRLITVLQLRLVAPDG